MGRDKEKEKERKKRFIIVSILRSQHEEVEKLKAHPREPFYEALGKALKKAKDEK